MQNTGGFFVAVIKKTENVKTRVNRLKEEEGLLHMHNCIARFALYDSLISMFECLKYGRVYDDLNDS